MTGADERDPTRTADGRTTVTAAPGVRAAAQAPLVGRVLDGKYRLDGVLGAGGMGVVYAATHLGTGRPHALKVIAGAHRAGPAALERFRREALAAGQLAHAHVVDVTDFGVADVDGAPIAYLVMERLTGGTLRERLVRRGPLPLDDVVAWVVALAAALDTAHARGILHRDLKPDNIVLEPDASGVEVIKVLDFGLAKFITEPAVPAQGQGQAPARDAADDASAPAPSPLTRAHTVLGTPAYLAPEQRRGEPASIASDVYALGVTVRELLTGHVSREAEERPGVAPLPRAVCAVLAWAQSDEPGARPASAGAFAEALRTAAGGAAQLRREARAWLKSHRRAVARSADRIELGAVLVSCGLLALATWLMPISLAGHGWPLRLLLAGIALLFAISASCAAAALERLVRDVPERAGPRDAASAVARSLRALAALPRLLLRAPRRVLALPLDAVIVPPGACAAIPDPLRPLSKRLQRGLLLWSGIAALCCAFAILAVAQTLDLVESASGPADARWALAALLAGLAPLGAVAAARRRLVARWAVLAAHAQRATTGPGPLAVWPQQRRQARESALAWGTVPLVALASLVPLAAPWFGGFALAVAIEGHVHTLRALIVEGFDPNTRPARTGSPLLSSIAGLDSRQSLRVLELLFAAGASVKSRSDEDTTPLMEAALLGRIDVARWLIAHGALADARTTLDVTPLHYASYGADTSLLDLLLAHGAAVDARDRHGRTPLMYAVQWSGPAAVRWFLAHGADPGARDAQGRSALDLAQMRTLNRPKAPEIRQALEDALRRRAVSPSSPGAP